MLLSLALLALIVPQQRDTSGPRAPYWQQQVAYAISASLDEPNGVLSGSETIAYVNRSPDTLTAFSLHLYLNAFRPGSRWADADSAEGRRRFNDLREPAFAFNHVRDVRIMGEAVTPIYPFAPDSTIVRFELPRALAPGDSMTVEMQWDARPSTTPRRQGRRGRRFDFAQWYPKVVVYDRHGWAEHPVYPGGEFYGEFATFLVTLDVPEDQVTGSTGVPVCGDPGWEKANRTAGRAIDYQRDYYGVTAATLGADCASRGAGRKTIVWYARDVHHFAMSLNPDYRYEGGRFDDVAVHVLYQPGDEQSWGGGVAVKRTEIALAWLDQLYGKFAWPQMTNVHRIEGGGTEFPMMVHNGSADQGLIVHEVGHNYTMGILANNEWREGFLDEGFTSFQTAWFWETAGRQGGYEGTEGGILQLDLQGRSEPTSLVSESYRDFNTYNTMIYSRGELFFEQLRYIVGDATMRRILRTYYDRWKLRHVDEAAFRDVAEEVSQRDLSTLFGQWLHAVELYDYGVGRVQRHRMADGRWRTRVEVLRKEQGRIPVEVAAIAGRDTTVVRAAGMAEREWVELVTASRPGAIVLDPRVRTHDWNMLNNRRRLGFRPLAVLLGTGVPTDRYLDTYFSRRVRRDQLTSGIAPALWYNDVGGLTIGLRQRDDYLGMFEQHRILVSQGTGWANPAGTGNRKDFNFDIRLKNPVFLRSPGGSQTLDAFYVEGRLGARLAVDRTSWDHLGFGPTRTHGASITWVSTERFIYLDPGAWDNAGTLEGEVHRGITGRSGSWQLTGRTSLGGGLSYANPGPGVTTDRRYDVQGYFRGTFEAIARRQLSRKLNFGVRLYGGAALAKDSVVRQRRIFLAGADPYEQLHNPFTRSRGSLFRQEKFNYHVPGGGNLRGFRPDASALSVLALNVELERAFISRPRAKLFRQVSLAAFGDFALADGDFSKPPQQTGHRIAGDAGLGIRAAHRIGQTDFVMRFDAPIYVGLSYLAQSLVPGRHFAWRGSFSFQPAF
ncbi:MAG: M1 family metallopeptidase [Gemmatimonadales bacterium]|nr:M1 family metallopeptidase [Gemmatimonadales bacterium]